MPLSDITRSELDLDHRLWLIVFGRREGRTSFYVLCALVAACAMLACTFLASIPFYAKFSPGQHHEVYVTDGRFNYEWSKTPRNRSSYVAINNTANIEWMFDHHRYPTSWFVRVPLWFPFVSLSALALWLVYCRRWGLFAPGCCSRCGYALRGLQADSGGDPGVTCPECGTLQDPIRPQNGLELARNGE